MIKTVLDNMRETEVLYNMLVTVETWNTYCQWNFANLSSDIFIIIILFVSQESDLPTP